MAVMNGHKEVVEICLIRRGAPIDAEMKTMAVLPFIGIQHINSQKY